MRCSTIQHLNSLLRIVHKSKLNASQQGRGVIVGPSMRVSGKHVFQRRLPVCIEQE